MSVLDEARSYLAQGWSVFPVGQDKRPLVAWLPYQKNRARPEQLAMWWATRPWAGVAIITGAISGLAVVDIDPRNGGADSLEKLVTEGLVWPNTPTARTGGGGTHYYFAITGRVSCRPSLFPGIDLKGEGGYVVAPPSLHPSGQLYAWEPGLSPAELPLAPLPAWVERRPTKLQKPPLPEIIPPGRRNALLASLAGSMRHRGASQEAIVAALLVENQRCSPPLPPEEVRAIAHSVAQYNPPASRQRAKPPASAIHDAHDRL